MQPKGLNRIAKISYGHLCLYGVGSHCHSMNSKTIYYKIMSDESMLFDNEIHRIHKYLYNDFYYIHDIPQYVLFFKPLTS
jgi:hypothetical protein